MLSGVHLLIGLVTKHLLGTYSVPKTVLSLGDSVVNEVVSALLSGSKHTIEGQYAAEGRQTPHSASPHPVSCLLNGGVLYLFPAHHQDCDK